MKTKSYTFFPVFVVCLTIFSTPLNAQRTRQSHIVDLTKQGKLKDEINAIGKFLGSVAQGNKGRGGVKSMTLNMNTGDIRGSIYVRHWHQWSYVDIFGTRQYQTAYDWTWKGKFAFNPKRATGHAVIDVGKGGKFNSKRIEQILGGDLSEILNMIPNPVNSQKQFRNDYDHIRDSYYRNHGQPNVYFASKRFVDWASPERAGNWIQTGFASGGPAAVAQAMKEVKRESFREFSNLASWLSSRGVSDAKSVATQLLSGEKVGWPYMTVKWQTVGYYSRTFVAGRPVTPEIGVRHGAFVIIWKRANSTPKIHDNHQQRTRQSFQNVVLKNPTQYNLSYKIKDGHRGFQSYSLPAGQSKQHSFVPSSRVEVMFDSSFQHGYQRSHLSVSPGNHEFQVSQGRVFLR